MKRTRKALATVVVGVVAAVVTAAPAWADTIVASADAEGVSDSVELYAYTSLVRDSANRLYAAGYDVESHEYQRRHHVVVTLEQRDAAGAWVVVARAEGSDVGGAAATTVSRAAGGALRACTAAAVDAGAPVTVCTG